MKKIFLPAIIAVLTMASCKKDRTCTCTSTPVSSTVNGVAQTVGSSTQTVTKSTKVKKGGVDCKSGEITTSASIVYSGTQYNLVDVSKEDCKLD